MYFSFKDSSFSWTLQNFKRAFENGLGQCYSSWSFEDISQFCFHANNCQKMQCVPYDLTFIFIELSETPNSVVKTRLVLDIKNVSSFIKTRFYLKRGRRKCVNMRKRSMLIRATNWRLLFLYQLCRFQNGNFLYTFQTLFARKRGLIRPYFVHENESLQLSVPYVTNSFIRSGFSNWSVFSSYNLTPAISQVLIGRHLIFCSPTWPTCCNSPRKYTPVKYKVRQKVGFSTVT